MARQPGWGVTAVSGAFSVGLLAANRRLNTRWRSFTERGKNPLVANVAVARELAGWCWSLATMQ
jgi:hypothetical protein